MGLCKGFDKKKISHDTRGLERLEAVKMSQQDIGRERVKECCGDTSKITNLNFLCMLTEIIYPASHFTDLT